MESMLKCHLMKIVIFIFFLLSPMAIHSAESEFLQYYISPAVNDLNDGLSDQTPFKTIQCVLDSLKNTPYEKLETSVI
jgi:hypothetical protein